MSPRRPLFLLLATLVAVAVLGIVGLGVEGDLQPTSLVIPGTASSRGEALARANLANLCPLPSCCAARRRRSTVRARGWWRRCAATAPQRLSLPWEGAAPAALRPAPDRALILVNFHQPLSVAIRDTVPALERTLAGHVHPPVTATQSGFATISRALQKESLERLRARRATRRPAADNRPASGLPLSGRRRDPAGPSAR